MPPKRDRDQGRARTSCMITTAPSQQFRSSGSGPEVQESRDVILETFARSLKAVRTCPICNIQLIGKHGKVPFAEPDGWCCGGANRSRQHRYWPTIPWDLATYDFSRCARVVNSLLSVAVVHGARDEGLSYRPLSYQAPVMTVNGQIYARLMRDANRCWFVHDSEYDRNLLALLKSADETMVLTLFTRLLRKHNSLHRNYENTVSLHESSRVTVLLDEETRMCSVYVSDNGNVTLPPARSMYVLGSMAKIDELDPSWEVLGYPVFHFTGDTSFAWSPGMQGAALPGVRTRPLSLLDYTRSVILMQPGFFKYGRLAEQWMLDMWARNEQHNVRSWMSPHIQDKLRRQAEAHGRLHVEGKIYLPNSIPGCHAYQRRFFHDALHLSRSRGPSHLFVTMTCNPNWPEVRALLDPNITLDLKHPSHQTFLARVFVFKRKQLIARLKERDYLFPGHCGVDWIVYSTEWQKGDLPHAHIAVRLKIDTERIPMNTQLYQISLMDQVVSACLPDEDAPHYHQVIAFMQHPSECKSCLREKTKGCGVKTCRFYFPKPVCAESRIDARGFPVYRRREGDERIVPHNWKLLVEFQCHINAEWTFNSRHLAYVYGYMCKGVDIAGVRIQDQVNEIASFRKARVLTVAEACYRILGFNVNFREPAVVVCPIYLPRGIPSSGDNDQFGHILDGDDEFGDREATAIPTTGCQFNERRQARTTEISFQLDYLEHYFKAERHDQLKFTDYYANYYAGTSVAVPSYGRQNEWKKRRSPIEARITWLPPYAGEIYFLRILLHHIPARNWADLYGPCNSFKLHCIHLGVVDTGEEYLYAMQDALADNQSPAACRHLFALFINSHDVLSLANVWSDVRIRTHLAIDFWPSNAHNETFAMNNETAEMLALMDIAVMVQGMGTSDFKIAMRNKDLPPTVTCENMASFQTSTPSEHIQMFQRYASIVGYSVRTGRASPVLEREILRFRDVTKVLSQEDLITEIRRLNTDQKCAFDTIMNCFADRHNPTRPHLFNINASAGCGKTFLMNRVIHAARCNGSITASVCSIGIGALQFDDGRTAHSFFSVPIQEETDVLSGLKLLSTIIKQLEFGPTARSEFLRALDLLVWDEIGAIKKDVFYCVDHLFRIIMGNDLPFGGKFVVTLGDWRQIPPVDESEGARYWDGDQDAFASIFQLSVKSTELYQTKFCKLSLSINERAKHDLPYHLSTTKVGNGLLGPDIPIDALTSVGVRLFFSIEDACEWLFLHDIPQPYDPVTVSQRAILSPYNADVDGINEYCEGEFVRFHNCELQQLLSVDEFIGGNVEQDEAQDLNTTYDERTEGTRIRTAEVRNLRMDLEEPDTTSHHGTDYDPSSGFNFDIGNAVETVHLGADAFSSENLNDLKFKGVPPHRLRLFRGAVVVLLRNLDAGNRLQNGVRLIVKDFIQGRNNRHPRVIVVVKAEDELACQLGGHGEQAKRFLLHRIKFMCKMGVGQDAVVCRRQFPIRMCNGVSIHKSQSMTLERSVIDARSGVFEHGQFFVAYSRCRRGQDTALLIRPGQQTVRNIVLKRFLEDE